MVAGDVMKLSVFFKSISHMVKLRVSAASTLGAGQKHVSPQVLISLTTIEYRLPRLHYVIRSLLNQSVSFKKIILWVNKDLKHKIPKSLLKLESERFEIRYSEGSSSHRKLVETLKIYPNEYIVTCDDDLMYPRDWLDRLLNEHAKYPQAVMAHMCRAFRFNEDGLMPYKKWRSEQIGASTDRTLAVGWGGILYPPGSLYKDVLDETLYMKLAPKADDFWFKAMAHLQGTQVYKSSCPNPEPIPILFTQKYSLMKSNIGQDENRKQWLALAKYYDLEIK